MGDSAAGRPRPSPPGCRGTAPSKVFTAIHVCNAGWYPGECVRPALDQTHAGTEVAAAADGSADSSADTRRVRRPRPRVRQASIQHCLLVLPGRPSVARRLARAARPTCPALTARSQGPGRHCGAPQDARRHRHPPRRPWPPRRGRVRVSGSRGPARRCGGMSPPLPRRRAAPAGAPPRACPSTGRGSAMASGGKAMLVAGSQGFIGSYVCAELLGRGRSIAGVDDYPKYGPPARPHGPRPPFRPAVPDRPPGGFRSRFPEGGEAGTESCCAIAGAAAAGGNACFRRRARIPPAAGGRKPAGMPDVVINRRRGGAPGRIAVAGPGAVSGNAAALPALGGRGRPAAPPLAHVARKPAPPGGVSFPPPPPRKVYSAAPNPPKAAMARGAASRARRRPLGAAVAPGRGYGTAGGRPA